MPEFESGKEGVTGSLFQRGDINSLVACVEQWMSAGHDRNVIRQNCYDMIDESFNPQFQVHAIVEALNK
jgi:hypothetical protein